MTKVLCYSITIQSDNVVHADLDGIPSLPGQLNIEDLEIASNYATAVKDDVFNKREQFQNLGNFLFSSIFRDSIKGHFHEQAWRKIAESSTDYHYLRIQIIFQSGVAAKVISLPWEFLYYKEADSFISTHPKIALSYCAHKINERSWKPLSEKSLRILFIHLHPEDLDGVGVIPVRSAINELSKLAHLDVKEKENPTVGEIRDAVMDFKPHVFHFLGHGDFKYDSGIFALLDRESKALWYDSQSFSDFFHDWKPHLCILHSCNSGVISEHIAFAGTANWLVNRNLPAVIAMRYPFKQMRGWTFIQKFYKELSDGNPIDLAVQKGRFALAMPDGEASHANRDFGAPLLWAWRNTVELLRTEAAEAEVIEEELNTNNHILPFKYSTSKGFKLDSTNINSQMMRQRYFNRLREIVGFIKIIKIVTDQADEIQLEKIYTPLPTNLSLNIQIRDRKVEKWSIESISSGSQNYLFDIGKWDSEYQPFDSAVIDIIVEGAEAIIDGTAEDNSYNRKRPLILAPLWQDQLIKNYYTLEAIDAVAAIEKVVILGDPGSGKSTFAKHLALSLLVPQLVPLENDVSIMGLQKWPHGLFIPIYVELRQFVLSEYFPDIEATVTADDFWSFVRNISLQGDNNMSAELLDSLDQGNAMIIMDGLDEIPVPLDIPGAELKRRNQLQSLIRSLKVRYPACRIIITSRPYAYEGWKLDGFQAVTLIPLQYEQKLQLATCLFYHTSDQKNVDGAEKRALRLIESLTNIPRSLTDRPLFLTLLSILFFKNEDLGLEGLPTNRGELIHENIKLLLGLWTESRRSGNSITQLLGCTEAELYERLENIAFRIHSKTRQVTDVPYIDLDIILMELFTLGPHVNPHVVLAYISQSAGILESPYQGAYRFAHRMFQEFMAASYLTKKDYSKIKTLIEDQPSTWREVMRLVGDILSEADRKLEIWRLIDVLLEKDSSLLFPSDDKRWMSVWLAAQLYNEQKLYIEKYIQEAVSERLKRWIKNLLLVSDALTPIERVSCAKTLSILGDDRHGVGLDASGIPDIYWCEIPAGKFRAGTSQEEITFIEKQPWASGWKFNRELPDFEFDLPTFYISQYVITQRQFKAFVDAADGYHNEAWWTPEGNLWRKQTTAPAIMKPDVDANLPQVEIRWYEATAFCKWLGSKLNKFIRLPNEMEWEKAARGTDGRIFPWGNEFNAAYCNVAETGIRSSCPVGCFSFPDSPWGANTPSDMIGNVWEWCSTICEIQGEKEYKYPYDAKDGREDMRSPDNYLRVLRGGCYLNQAFFMRAAYRGRDKPNVKLPYEGFRVVWDPKE